MPTPHKPRPSLPTDWGRVAAWYDQLVGGQGSEYHQHVVLPGVMRLLGDVAGQRILDVACGQGVLCRLLAAAGAEVTGIDAAAELIQSAIERGPSNIRYHTADAQNFAHLFSESQISNLKSQVSFHSATCILAIQNIHPIQPVFDQVASLLAPAGRFIIVMMHPCFRGPKETSWDWDNQKKVQYRRVDRYLIPRKSPIFSNPGVKDGTYTWTFHKPIQDYVKALRKAGLVVDGLEEWPSHKTSDSGPRAAAENQSRKEIPLFMAIRALKLLPPSQTA